jgi:hypothetical protein
LLDKLVAGYTRNMFFHQGVLVCQEIIRLGERICSSSSP